MDNEYRASLGEIAVDAHTDAIRNGQETEPLDTQAVDAICNMLHFLNRQEVGLDRSQRASRRDDPTHQRATPGGIEMTRKDYILIAKAITDTQERIRESFAKARRENGGDPEALENLSDQQDAQLRGVRRTAAHLCDALKADNPRFEPGTFLKACGYGATSMSPRDPALDLRPLPGEGLNPITRCPKCGCTVFQSSDSTSDYCSAHATA